MSRLRTLLSAVAGLFAARPSAAVKSPAPLSRPVMDPAVSAALGHRYGARLGEGGNPPDNFGRSPECARMVRKNLHRDRFESRRREKGARPCTAKR